MNELDLWLSFDALEPACVSTLLDELYERLAPMREEAQARAMDRVLAALDEALAPHPEEGALNAVALPFASPAVEVARAGRMVAEEAEEAEVGVIAATRSVSIVEAPVAEEKDAASLIETKMTLDLPPEAWRERGRLPFGPPSPARPKAVKTMEVPAMRVDLGDTAPIGDDSIARAVAAVPFPDNTVGTGTVPFPRMSVVTYARFCVEMRFWPEHEADIFKRFRVVHRAARKAMDAHWGEVLAAKVDERAAFDRAAAEYAAMLRAMWATG